MMLRDPVHQDVPQTVSGSKSCQESGAGEERSCSRTISIHVTAKVVAGSFHVAYTEPQFWLILCHFGGTRRYFWDCSYFSLPSCSVYTLSHANLKPDLSWCGDLRIHVPLLFFPQPLHTFFSSNLWWRNSPSCCSKILFFYQQIIFCISPTSFM